MVLLYDHFSAASSRAHSEHSVLYTMSVRQSNIQSPSFKLSEREQMKDWDPAHGVSLQANRNNRVTIKTKVFPIANFFGNHDAVLTDREYCIPVRVNAFRKRQTLQNRTQVGLSGVAG